MDYNLKRYRILKVKKNLKNSSLLFFYHSAKIESNKWMFTEQRLKQIKLKYNQIYNGTAIKTINNSIYMNISSIICGVSLFITSNYKSTPLKLKTIKNDLEPLFILLFIKLNNKVYTISQFNNLNILSYKKTVFNLNCNLEKYIKISYKLTNESK